VRSGKNSHAVLLKRLVRRSLTDWIGIRHPNVEKSEFRASAWVRFMPDRGRGYVRWRQYDWDQESNMSRKSKFTGLKTRRYTWEIDGLNSYKRWWRARMKTASWDLVPGIDAVARAANSSWFEWIDGSRPFRWRWPDFYQRVVRDGLKVHFISKNQNSSDLKPGLSAQI
jgi:hypothetical protein